VRVVTTEEPRVSWADTAASGTRSPWSDGGLKVEEADHQSTQTGYGDERRAKDGEAIQADNTFSTVVTSEQSEETERRCGRKRNVGEGGRKSEVGNWWRIALNQSKSWGPPQRAAPKEQKRMRIGIIGDRT